MKKKKPVHKQVESPPAWKVVTLDTPKKMVSLFFPEHIDKHYGNPLRPEEKSFDEVQQRFDKDLRWLVQRAVAGDGTAVSVIARIGTDAACFLEHISKVRLAVVKAVARQLVEWPVIITPEPNHPQNQAEVRKRLELGAGLILRADKMKYRKKDKFQNQLVFQILSVFEQAQRLKALGIKHDQIAGSLRAFDLKTTKTTGSQEDIAVATQALRGELTKARNGYDQAMLSFMSSHQRVRALLGLPALSPDPSSAKIAELCNWVVAAKGISAETKAVWADKVVEYVTAVVGEGLEENEILRPLGEPSGDVVIRSQCRITGNRDEFNAKKRELRHDPGVNGAIRTRIKQKLIAAFRSIVR